MKKAFTIIELIVAMALLMIMIAISGVIFSTAVKAFRVSSATAEIMQDFRSITDQLNRDFKSVDKTMPFTVWFEQDATGARYDQIQFFATGSFQTSRQWSMETVPATATTSASYELRPVSGSAARIYYGNANIISINPASTRIWKKHYNFTSSLPMPFQELSREKIVARRVHVIAPTQGIPGFPTMQYPATSSFPDFQTTFLSWAILPALNPNPQPPTRPAQPPGSGNGLCGNDVCDFDKTTLTEWKSLFTTSIGVANQYISTCFNNPNTVFPITPTYFGGRPAIDLSASDGESLHMVLAQGVGSFTVQFSYTKENVVNRTTGAAGTFAGIRWWPSISGFNDFGTAGMNKLSFGYYANLPIFSPLNVGTTVANWGNSALSYPAVNAAGNWRFSDTYFPSSIKFTFTLYDSKGVFPNGKTFTYIVNL